MTLRVSPSPAVGWTRALPAGITARPISKAGKSPSRLTPNSSKSTNGTNLPGKLKARVMVPPMTSMVTSTTWSLATTLSPRKLDQCAYRGCGGWGYYYMNLTTAILSLYREATPDITVLALSAQYQPVVRKREFPLAWRTLGKNPKSYTLELDGHVVADKLTGNSYTLSLSAIPPGKHHITLTAHGVHTYFDLSPSKLATRSSRPLPVTSEIEFTYSPGAGQK